MDGKYFKFTELIKSDIATKNGIDNYPKSAEIISNIFDVIIVMDKVRTLWKEQIIVTSGYRCDELNELVGGAENSGHKYGNAADLITTNGRTAELFEFMKQFLKDNNIQFDELILEDGWIHFSLKSWKNEHRKKSIDTTKLIL